MKQTFKVKYLLYIGIACGIGFFIYGGSRFIKKILQMFGVELTPEEKRLEAEKSNPDSVWNPVNQYYNDANMTYAAAEIYAKDIYNSISWFGDDEDKVLMTIKKCRSKADFNYLCKVFSDMYSSDMLSFLEGGFGWKGLSSQMLAKINDYVNLLK